eukprot:scaffold9729_cov108-Isochrysis_galbana.AAC.10
MLVGPAANTPPAATQFRSVTDIGLENGVVGRDGLARELTASLTRQEGGHSALALLPQGRAGGVGQRATRLDATGGGVQERRLQRAQLGETTRRRAPELRVATQRAQARARRVAHHRIRQCQIGRVELRRVRRQPCARYHRLPRRLHGTVRIGRMLAQECVQCVFLGPVAPNSRDAREPHPVRRGAHQADL